MYWERSEKHGFNGIVVYQLDRFARNRYDSAINKSKLSDAEEPLNNFFKESVTSFDEGDFFFV